MLYELIWLGRHLKLRRMAFGVHERTHLEYSGEVKTFERDRETAMVFHIHKGDVSPNPCWARMFRNTLYEWKMTHREVP